MKKVQHAIFLLIKSMQFPWIDLDRMLNDIYVLCVSQQNIEKKNMRRTENHRGYSFVSRIYFVVN